MPTQELSPYRHEKDDSIRHMRPDDPRLRADDGVKKDTSKESVKDKRNSWNPTATKSKPSHDDVSASEGRRTRSLSNNVRSSDTTNDAVQAPKMKSFISDSVTQRVARDSVVPNKGDSDERGRQMRRVEQADEKSASSHDHSHGKRSKGANNDSTTYQVAQSQPIQQPRKLEKARKDESSKSASRNSSKDERVSDRSKSSHRSSNGDDTGSHSRRDGSHASDKVAHSRSTSRKSEKSSSDLLEVPGTSSKGTHHSRSVSPGVRKETEEHKALKHTKSDSNIDSSAKHRRGEQSSRENSPRGKREEDSTWYTGNTLQIPGDGYLTDSSGYSSSHYSSRGSSRASSPEPVGVDIEVPSDNDDEDSPTSRNHRRKPAAHHKVDISKAKKVGLNDIRPDMTTTDRMGCALKELLFCRRMFKEWTEQLYEFDPSYSGADTTQVLESIRELSESIEHAIKASKSLIEQHVEFSREMVKTLKKTSDSETGILLRPEELNHLGDKIDQLSSELSQHIARMQDRLDGVVQNLEELRREIADNWRQKVLRFLKKLFNVLSNILKAVVVIAPLAGEIGLVISAVSAGGTVIFSAASRVCEAAVKDYEEGHAQMIKFLSQDVRGEIERVAKALRNVQDCQRVLQLDVNNQLHVMETGESEVAMNSWLTHKNNLKKARGVKLEYTRPNRH